MNKKGGTSVWVIGVIIVLVIVGILIFINFGGEKVTKSEISVSDQRLEGNILSIGEVALDKSGFVVVHKDDGGKPGEVIGNSELISGRESDVKVEINSNKAGSRVFVMLHYDNGDGEYTSLDEDKPVVLDGNVVVKAVVFFEEEEISGNVVKMTADGFSPSTITIKSGESVSWVNENTGEHQPASNDHPTHTLYPGSSANKCNGPDEANTFDACRGISSGGSYTFTFTKKGTWGYHDHLSSGTRGTVIVQ